MKIPPREVPSRDNFYMGKAFFEAARSKDPRTQIGAVIISNKNKPLGTGYNGPPQYINDAAINWDRPAKYPFIVHAEKNAINHSKRSKLVRSTIYVTAAPCKACMLDIVDAGISRVVYFRPKADPGSLLSNNEEWLLTQEIAELGLVSLDEFVGDVSWTRERILYMESIGLLS